MKKKTSQMTVRFEEHNFEDLKSVSQYMDIAAAELARHYILEGLYRDLEKMDPCLARDDARGAMLRGIQVIKRRRALMEGETVCA